MRPARHLPKPWRGWDFRQGACHEIIRQRVEKYAIDCDLKFGYMDVAIKARHWRALEEEYDSLQRPDFPHETRLVSKQEITGVIGTDAYIGGQWVGNQLLALGMIYFRLLDLL